MDGTAGDYLTRVHFTGEDIELRRGNIYQLFAFISTCVNRPEAAPDANSSAGVDAQDAFAVLEGKRLELQDRHNAHKVASICASASWSVRRLC